MSKIDDLIKYYNWKSDPDPEWSIPSSIDYDTLKEEIENKLKVLEIIKNKKFVISWKTGLTVEEIALIKEWLEDE